MSGQSESTHSTKAEGLSAPSTINPVFVVGPLRSGTSLLYAILNQHPDLALMYECDVWDFPQILSGPRFRGDWQTRMEFYNRSLSRHRLIFGDGFSGLENVHTPEGLYRVYGQTKDARLYGEKSPFYCTRLRQLARNHPGGSFILIWRNPVEIYRSVKQAAMWGSNFFQRSGMLSRLIYYQERMIHEAAALTNSGKRVHHVTYSDLVDRTEETCRGICKFLGLEFDGKMLDIKNADLSAVFEAPQHEYLRRGKIERRRPRFETSPQVVQKLERFHCRWNRLRHQFFNHRLDAFGGTEPSLPERLYHRVAGSLLCCKDSAKRALFEFLPLPWLRTYRQAKAWFLAGYASDRFSPLQELRGNKATIALSLFILAIVGVADYLTSYQVSLLPFYVVPPAILALVINWRWGTFGAIASMIVWALVQNLDNPIVNIAHPAIWLWDTFMRFLVAEAIVLLLGRIHIEIKLKSASRDYR